jgi:hypothetical protein
MTLFVTIGSVSCASPIHCRKEKQPWLIVPS